ncbi:hypothetical protein [Amycolatopsis jiangsuensis]|uniref:Putative membrane protein YhdT n=1 Tax=Amycolatopsis jiangsuensis TaxID=1181879 RepID=A0A840IP15_9PSEU|nr:hypothetical protein [Amycolatopsis jiangsuensis]MBB4683690.1 putative membrane protein YhdT [Amycolatopsis jiangsuensis]
MGERDEARRAAEALAAVHTHQERAEKAARLPWWVYALTFLASAGLGVAGDFVDLNGAKFIAAVVIALFVVVFVAGALSRGSAPLSRVRGVQARRDVPRWQFGLVIVVLGLCLWLLTTYGHGLATGLAGALGLRGYPNSVLGVVFGAVFTLLFALSQFTMAALRKRSDR